MSQTILWMKSLIMKISLRFHITSIRYCKTLINFARAFLGLTVSDTDFTGCEYDAFLPNEQNSLNQ